MKMIIRLFIALLIIIASAPGISAETKHDSHGNLIRDTLVIETGKIISGQGLAATNFFLDVNNDNTPDYYLDFGPAWYAPDDSSLVMPGLTDNMKLEGIVRNEMINGVPIFIVCYINDKTWRIPHSSKWNNLGRHIHSPSHHENQCIPYCFGWESASLQEMTLSGSVLVDTTLGHNMYFLDTNADGNPEYYLNFGPPWYKPASGAALPGAGQSITILAGVIARTPYSMAIVYELNGLEWFSNSFSSTEGSGWLVKDITEPVSFHSVFDPMDRLTFNPGWKPGPRDPQGVPDTVFVQIMELDPFGIPGDRNQNIFAAYETSLFYPDRTPAMFHHGFCGVHIHLVTDIQYQLHYTDDQLRELNIDENTIKARYWYDHDDNWQTFSDAVIDKENNTITVAKNTVLNLVILTGQSTATDVTDKDISIKQFSLDQNYPNPFNPATKIRYSLPYEGQVKLSLYDVLGKEIAVLLDQHQNAGSFEFNFNSQNYGGIASGIFFYKLEVTNPNNLKANYSAVRKLILLK